MYTFTVLYSLTCLTLCLLLARAFEKARHLPSVTYIWNSCFLSLNIFCYDHMALRMYWSSFGEREREREREREKERENAILTKLVTCPLLFLHAKACDI